MQKWTAICMKKNFRGRGRILMSFCMDGTATLFSCFFFAAEFSKTPIQMTVEFHTTFHTKKEFCSAVHECAESGACRKCTKNCVKTFAWQQRPISQFFSFAECTQTLPATKPLSLHTVSPVPPRLTGVCQDCACQVLGSAQMVPQDSQTSAKTHWQHCIEAQHIKSHLSSGVCLQTLTVCRTSSNKKLHWPWTEWHTPLTSHTCKVESHLSFAKLFSLFGSPARSAWQMENLQWSAFPSGH